MFKEIFDAIKSATARIVRDWKLSTMLIAAFGIVLTGIWIFANVGVGSIARLAAGLFSVLVASIVFVFVQAIGVSYVSESKSPSALLKNSSSRAWKIFVVSIPVIALAWLVSYLAHKGELAVVPMATDGYESIGHIDESRSNTSWFSDWRILLIGTVRVFLHYLLLPMIAIQLWISTSEAGILVTMKHVFGVLRESIKVRSLITFLVGAMFFGVIPYFLLTFRTPSNAPYAELLVFGARVLLASLLVLFGWTITIGALKLLNSKSRGQLSTERTDEVPARSDALAT